MNRENLVERIDIIEKMIVAGRQNQAYWGEIFILWGIAVVISAGLVQFAELQPSWVWPLTMVPCGLITGYWGYRSKRSKGTETTVDRVIGAIWTSGGITLFVSLFLLGYYGYESSISIVLTLVLGLVNFACGLVLRFRVQMVMGVLWWFSFVGYLITPVHVGYGIVIGMVVVGEIFFGIYLMILERQERLRGTIA